MEEIGIEGRDLGRRLIGRPRRLRRDRSRFSTPIRAGPIAAAR